MEMPISKNSGRRWTPDKDKRLLELRAEGKSRELIAAALYRSAKSIPSRLYALDKAAVLCCSLPQLLVWASIEGVQSKL
jgi:hypothetical protein